MPRLWLMRMHEMVLLIAEEAASPVAAWPSGRLVG
jgi:hypothetical protein